MIRDITDADEVARTPWPVGRVDGWENFVRFCNGFARTGPASTTGYFFRGQSCSRWSLTPSLLRALSPNVTSERAIEIERRALREFVSQGHLHLPASVVPANDDPVDWWTLMQHHRAPTRLLDWTKSPYVAAYFAVCENLDDDGAIWMFFVREVQECMAARFGQNEISKVRADYIIHPAARRQLFAVERATKSVRMVAQQGGFTICSQVLGDHERIIHSCYAQPHAGKLLKLIIPRKRKRSFLKQLRAMNVTASSLYPGADGLGRSVQELVLVDAAPDAR